MVLEVGVSAADPTSRRSKGTRSVIIIGIDRHKSTHTATALEPATNTDLGSLRIEATLAEYTRLLTWSKTWPQRTWAIENAEGLGQWLLAAGESVLDIPTTATARVRQLSKGSRRKNDRIDAASAQSNRHRLSRYGDRQLNSAIHTVAMVQMRMPGSAGRAYYDKKRTAGMPPKSAMRCLKHHLSNHLWRIMIADEQRQHTHRISSNTMAG